MKQLSHYILIGLCALVGIGLMTGWGFSVWALFSARAEATTAHKNLLVAQENIAKSEQLRELLRKTAPERAVLADTASYSAPEIVALVRDIAKTSGVSITITGASATEGELAGFKKVPFLSMSISSTAAFDDLVRFVELLEAAPVASAVTSASLEKTVDQWELRLRLVVYSENLQ